MKLNDVQSAEIDELARVLDEVDRHIDRTTYNRMELEDVIEFPSRIIAEMLYLRGVRVSE